MKRADRFVCTALLLFCVSLFLSCSFSKNKNDQEIQFVIGVSQANLFEPWRIAMTKEIKEEAALYPFIRIVIADASDSSERQLDDLKRLEKLGIDLLIISPVDSLLLTPEVSRLHKFLPVIVLDRGVEGYDYTVYIGPDNTLIGNQAGFLVRELLGNEGGTVLELTGRYGSPPSEARSAGFRSVVDLAGTINIVDSIEADWLRDTAEDFLLEKLPQYPHLDAVFAQNDAMALGALRAIELAGLKNIQVIGVDGLSGPSGGLALVKAGKLAGTFICPTGGRESIAAAIDILRKEGGIPKQIILRSRLITKETVFEIPNDVLHEKVSDRKIILGFSQPGRESEWRIANIDSIKSAAKDSGIELRMTNANIDQSLQRRQIREFIRTGVDIIAFSPLVEDGWDDVLREARDAGIPVICSDRSVRTYDETLVTTYIGADFVEEGRRAARWLVENVFAKERTLRILELSGTPNSAPTNGRRSGFREILKGYLHYSIVEEISGDFRKSEGKRVMAEHLESFPGSFDIVYAHNDDMALGAIEAIEAFGLVLGKDIFIISVDGVKDAFKAMIAGKLACTVECNPLLGPQLMKAVSDWAEGRALPLRIITEEGVFPASVARKEINARKY